MLRAALGFSRGAAQVRLRADVQPAAPGRRCSESGQHIAGPTPCSACRELGEPEAGPRPRGCRIPGENGPGEMGWEGCGECAKG